MKQKGPLVAGAFAFAAALVYMETAALYAYSASGSTAGLLGGQGVNLAVAFVAALLGGGLAHEPANVGEVQPKHAGGAPRRST